MSKPVTSHRFFFARWVSGTKLSGIKLCGIALAALIVVAALLIAGSPASLRPALASSSGTTAVPATPAPAITPATRARISARYAALPLAFEANQGQVDSQVKYLARGNGYALFLTGNDAVISLYSSARHAERTQAGRLDASTSNHSRASNTQELSTSVVRMHLVNGNSRTKVTASDRLPGKINYYLGNDPSKWQTDVGQYARVSYENVYPGVNMAYHGAQRQMEFDFIVAPGANSAPIQLGFSGARKISTDDSGNLVLSSSNGDLMLHRPIAYQEQNGARQFVDARFVVKANNQVAFALGPYDRTRELVIDPSLTYATYLGGNAEDEAVAIAVDSSGNAYVAGQTSSPNFPSSSGSHGSPTFLNAFITKLNGTAAAIDFTTIIGGTNGNDAATGIALNGTSAYAVGNVNSTDFPVLPTLGPGGGQDVFVAKLDATAGAQLYLTRLGGSNSDAGEGIAVDGSGNAYITGQTSSTDFKTVSPIQSALKGKINAFIGKLNSTGTSFTYSTYLGGTTNDLGTGIGLDGSNNAYVVGITDSSDFPTSAGAFQTKQPGVENAFVAAINAAGSAPIYATYLGGSNTDDGLGIAVDFAGEAYVTGFTSSSNFPAVNAAQSALKGGKDVFVSKLNSSGSALLFSTFYGGTLDDVGTGIALDSFNDAYVTGRTLSTDYPTSGSPFHSSLSGAADAFITEFSNTGFVEYSSYLGDTGTANSFAGNAGNSPLGAVAVDSSSGAYLAGGTTSGLPVSSGVVQSLYGGNPADGFAAKISAAPADFSIALSPTSISTTSGTTTGTITVTVSSVNSAFGSAVTLSCGNKPSKSACDFSTLSVTPGTTAVTSNLTISTNGSTGNAMLAPPVNRRSQMFYALFLPIGGLALLGAGLGSRNNRLFAFLCFILILTGLLILPACGGSGGGGGGGGGNNTPPGNYNITVTGTAGGTAHSATLALTVN